eukprot:TRINITY_DN7798_c0_g4_i1.p1 TRINITY_DN7798_c0_g4~~TRINITY_DN7798_c0_g4_i1.p1  ORF type:complete len:643 (-),score=134.50 TRINITY_DN7798_c0_g4_i1:194-2047(-)
MVASQEQFLFEGYRAVAIQEAIGEILLALSSTWGRTLQNDVHLKLRNFDAHYPLQMPIDKFIKHLGYLGGRTPTAYSCAMVYLLKVLAAEEETRVSLLNVHRLFAMCFLLAIKNIEDTQFIHSMDVYANFFGIPKHEAIALEGTLLEVLGWRCHVPALDQNYVAEEVVGWAMAVERYRQQGRDEFSPVQDAETIPDALRDIPIVLAKRMRPPPPGLPVAPERPMEQWKQRCRALRLTAEPGGDALQDAVLQELAGTYVEAGTNHGRTVYKKEANGKYDDVYNMYDNPKPLYLYYWEDRDRPTWQGWWLGHEVGGHEWWLHNARDSDTPPASGWTLLLPGREVRAMNLVVGPDPDHQHEEDEEVQKLFRALSQDGVPLAEETDQEDTFTKRCTEVYQYDDYVPPEYLSKPSEWGGFAWSFPRTALPSPLPGLHLPAPAVPALTPTTAPTVGTPDSKDAADVDGDLDLAGLMQEALDEIRPQEAFNEWMRPLEAGGAEAALRVQVTTSEAVPEGDKMDSVVQKLLGQYQKTGVNHGRLVYKQLQDENTEDRYLYYWDDRDGPNYRGWWFGTAVGGTWVLSFNACEADVPPASGWRIPWDKEVVSSLDVVPLELAEEKDW